MSDIGADQEAAIEMVEQAEDRLFAQQPNHELVSYLSIKDKAERGRAWQKLLRRFSREPQAEGNVKGTMETTYALTGLLMALEIALGEREPPKEEKVSTEKEQLPLSEDDLKNRMRKCACGQEYDPFLDSRGISRLLEFPEKCDECNSEAVNAIVENEYQVAMKGGRRK